MSATSVETLSRCELFWNTWM
ncbi:unnamed protein product [Ectocarpus sp. CCAP 1310/34]|nr:unnamed protein product [Ectocarpus sp. CCAP 1310/34]